MDTLGLTERGRTFLAVLFVIWLGAASAGAGWEFQTVDSDGDTGQYVSLGVDAAGHPHLTYHASGRFKYATWTGTSWQIEAVDRGPQAGEFASMVLDAEGRPHAAYAHAAPSELRYAFLGKSGWVIETVEADCRVSGRTSIGLEADGRPAIAYFDGSAVKFARRTTRPMEGEGRWEIQPVETEETVIPGVAMVMMPKRGPIITYRGSEHVKRALWTGSTWTVETHRIGPRIQSTPAVAVDTTGYGHATFRDSESGQIQYVRVTAVDRSTVAVSPTGSGATHPQIALDVAGRPHILFVTALPQALIHARWDGMGFVSDTMAEGVRPGPHTAIAVDAEGHPHVAYYSGPPDRVLHYARWTESAEAARPAVAGGVGGSPPSPAPGTGPVLRGGGPMPGGRGEDRGSPGRYYRNSWAVLVGIDQYPSMGPASQLSYAVSDVDSMAQLLTEKFGFDPARMTVLKNAQATREGIMGALTHLADPRLVSADDRVIVFFAGHGETVPLPRTGEMGFLIPYDGKVRLGETANPAPFMETCVPMSRLKEISRLIPAKHVLFLVDACYSGLAAATYGVQVARQHPQYLSEAAVLQARQVLTAGRRGELVAEDPEWGHSAFTYKLLEGLKTGQADENGDGVVTASELANYVAGRVPQIARQTPQFRLLNEGEGDFLFVRE